MIQQQVYLFNTFIMLMDTCCIIAASYAAYFTKASLSGFIWNMDNSMFIMSVLIVMFVNNYVMDHIGLYSEKKQPALIPMYARILQSVAIDFAVLVFLIFVVNYDQYSRAFLILFAGYTFMFIVFQRTLVSIYCVKLAGKNFHSRKILITGDSERSEVVAGMLMEHLSLGHEIVGFLPVDEDQKRISSCMTIQGTIKDLPECLKSNIVDDVIFALGATRNIDMNNYLGICEKMGITAKILPAMWTPEGRRISVESYLTIPFLTVNSISFNAAGMLYKRLLDIIGSIAGLMILVLLYPFVAIALKLDSPGPVIFKQKRKGQHGRIFELYKFRTMVADAESRKKELMAENQMNGPIFKLKNDLRITKFGKWLRNTSIDEIPQFINVFKGEMSLVGTRPPTLDEVEEYDIDQYKRIAMKPGITGLWQVSGRNRITDFNQIVALDCQYMEEWSFINDIKILFRTIYVVLRRKGAM